jgi:hypothetical protein
MGAEHGLRARPAESWTRPHADGCHSPHNGSEAYIQVKSSPRQGLIFNAPIDVLG